jgi:ElaB/YqjD/DUF883 family membrane-anchored ribosome-binding protein
MIDRIREPETPWTATAGDLSERAKDLAATAREGLSRGTEKLRDYAQNEPVRALGLAFGMGVFLGWLIKRR